MPHANEIQNPIARAIANIGFASTQRCTPPNPATLSRVTNHGI